MGERRGEDLMEGRELEVAERLIERWCPATEERGGEPSPPSVEVVDDGRPADVHPIVVCLGLDEQAVTDDVPGRPEELEATAQLAGADVRRTERQVVQVAPPQVEAVGERAAAERSLAGRRIGRGVGDREADPPDGPGEAVVVDDERSFAGRADVRVGVDVLAHAPVVADDVVQQEVARPREPGTAVQDGHDLAVVARLEALVDRLVPGSPAELHPVALAEPLELAVAEHRQAGQRRHERRHAEVLVTAAELLDGRLLVRVAHEVHEPAEDLRIELERLAHHPAVGRVVLVTEEVHERAVVDTVHPERPDEVALHEPERLGEEERPRCLGGDPVDHLTPELDRHRDVEFTLRHGVLGPRRDRPAAARQRVPEPLDVALGEDHRGVEADDRELPGDVEDGLDHGLPNVGPDEVELGRVVPGEARAVVAVVDVALVAGPAIRPLEDDRGVGVVPVVILEDDGHPLVRREVRSAEGVGREWRPWQREEPVGVLHHPS